MYCRHWNFRPFYILLGSYIYCFGNFALYTGIMHPFFLNPMIYLPLLLLGIEKIFERKSPAVFVLSVFLSAVSNFYFFYMLSIFMFIYAVFRYVMIFHKIQLKELVGWLSELLHCTYWESGWRIFVSAECTFNTDFIQKERCTLCSAALSSGVLSAVSGFFCV